MGGSLSLGAPRVVTASGAAMNGTSADPKAYIDDSTFFSGYQKVGIVLEGRCCWKSSQVVTQISMIHSSAKIARAGLAKTLLSAA
jgi:hypothetical protein